jgi:hypothetical protein
MRSRTSHEGLVVGVGHALSSIDATPQSFGQPLCHELLPELNVCSAP